jgi:hypothetical protein
VDLIVPGEELHDQVRSAVLRLADVAHAGDVLGGELGGDPRFAQEAGEDLGGGDEIGVEELEGDALIQHEVRRLEDDAHAAAAQLPLDAVLAGDEGSDRGGIHLRHGKIVGYPSSGWERYETARSGRCGEVLPGEAAAERIVRVGALAGGRRRR